MGWLSFGIAFLAAAAIIGIGLWYILAPGSAMKAFGLPLPALSESTFWWLRLKGSRDIVSGLVVLGVLVSGHVRMLGIVLAIEALIPAADMTIVLMAGGSKKTALSVHGLTALIMVFAAVPLMTGVVQGVGPS